MNTFDFGIAQRFVRDRQEQVRTDMAWQRAARRQRAAERVTRGRRARPGR